jgi:hypothetical protein
VRKRGKMKVPRCVCVIKRPLIVRQSARVTSRIELETAKMSPEIAINTALDKPDKTDRMISFLEQRCITQEKTIGGLSLQIASVTQRAEIAKSEWIALRQ